MRCRSLLTAVLVAAGAMLSASCGATDDPVAPTHPTQGAATPSRSQVLAAPVTVIPLQRTTPLAMPISRSACFGMFGGGIVIPDAGFALMVPPLALLSPTCVTVTALAGSNVAYTFQPHGITFLTPLVGMQSLQNITATNGSLGSLTLSAGYFPDNSNVLSVTELLTVNVDVLGLSATFSIPHFSGYILASGVAADDSTQY
jgi:hypothetical protein